MGELVLVTGGAGYVGSHLTRKLLARGHRVRVLDNLVYGNHGLDALAEHAGLELINGDICDEQDLARAVKGVRAVVALAAIVGDAACDLDPSRTMAINYESTRQTLAACRAAKVERLVFASSCSVYGANGNDFLDEGSHLNPVSLYARTRIMSEDLLLNQQDVEVIILRLATVCGVSPRMRFDLMVNTMTACATAQGAIRVSGAKQWRPHLHVQDAAEAFLLGVEAKAPREQIFNVGSDSQNYTVGETAERVAQQVPNTRIEYAPDSNDARSYRVSFDRIRNVLGFQPQRTVDHAIGEVGTLLTSGAVADFRNEQFHNAKWLSANGRLQGAA
ncbi:MAG: NAD-dependent epimerase/dehydratase family protein [Candidatus Binatia bacterium]